MSGKFAPTQCHLVSPLESPLAPLYGGYRIALLSLRVFASAAAGCVTLAASLLALCGPAASAQTPVSATPGERAQQTATSRSESGRDYGKLPLSFEANRGQTDKQVRFISRGDGYSLFLSDQEAVLSLSKSGAKKAALPGAALGKAAARDSLKTDVVRMQLAGAAPGLKVSGEEQLPGTANYFIGSDPAKWHSNVPTYAKVKYAGVYPGVDLVYYGNQRQLEYDFVVAPGADAKQVRVHFSGAGRLRLNSEGDLTVIAKNGEIVFHKPVIYQLKSDQKVSSSASQRELVDGKFRLLAGNTVGFSLGDYDTSRELVIDPTLAYWTYLGGSGYQGCCGDSAHSIAVDSTGDVYVTGPPPPAISQLAANPFKNQSLSRPPTCLPEMFS